MENVKLIPSILPDYISLLANRVSHDSILRDFDYTLVTTYFLKWIRAVRMQQDKITTLKFNDFNLGDQKNYSILSPHKYLTRMKEKN